MKKVKAEKTRNNKTMTESAFLSFLRSALRRQSMYWKPIQEIKKLNRRPYEGENVRQKWEYQCSICKDWYCSKEIEVDHAKPVGSLLSLDDLKDFVNNLFCEIDNLRILCKNCHSQVTKTQKQKSNAKQ